MGMGHGQGVMATGRAPWGMGTGYRAVLVPGYPVRVQYSRVVLPVPGTADSTTTQYPDRPGQNAKSRTALFFPTNLKPLKLCHAT